MAYKTSKQRKSAIVAECDGHVDLNHSGNNSIPYHSQIAVECRRTKAIVVRLVHAIYGAKEMT